MTPGHETRLDKLLETGLVVCVVVAVAVFGGTEHISWNAVQAALLLLGLVVMLRGTAEPSAAPQSWLGFVALLVLFGIAWLPFGERVFDRTAARDQALRLASYASAFFVTLAVARSPKARRRLAAALVGLGVAEALYGLVQYLTGWQRIFTYVKMYYLRDATGTYINHNHFAGLLEMIIPLGVGLALWHAQRALQPSDRRARRSLGKLLGQTELQKSLFLIFASLVCLLAIAFSQSRMGLISSVTSILLLLALLATRQGSRTLSAALLIALLAAGVGLTFWIGVEPIVSRFASLPAQESLHRQSGGRAAIWKDAVQLIRRHPWLGVGPGGFLTAFTEVQTVHLDQVVDHAHNDYLELTAEYGLLGATLLFGIIFTITARTLRAFYVPRGGAEPTLSLGVVGGLVALLLHGLTDFNLYIPANGLVFVVLLGLGDSSAAELREWTERRRAHHAVESN